MQQSKKDKVAGRGNTQVKYSWIKLNKMSSSYTVCYFTSLQIPWESYLSSANIGNVHITVPFSHTPNWSSTSTPYMVTKFWFIANKYHVLTGVQIKAKAKQGEQ